MFSQCRWLVPIAARCGDVPLSMCPSLVSGLPQAKGVALYVSVCASVAGSNGCRYREVRRTVHKSGRSETGFGSMFWAARSATARRAATHGARSADSAGPCAMARPLCWLGRWHPGAKTRRVNAVQAVVQPSTIRPRRGCAAPVPAGFSGSSSRLSCNMRGMSASTTLVACERQGSSTSTGWVTRATTPSGFVHGRFA